ncbi:MAG: hypothetical protein ACT4QF_20035 [Sporichthyaceae bacterium]|jgi:hypothetical protein
MALFGFLGSLLDTVGFLGTVALTGVLAIVNALVGTVTGPVV